MPITNAGLMAITIPKDADSHSEAAENGSASRRSRDRHHLGIAISILRNRDRHQIETLIGIARNPQIFSFVPVTGPIHFRNGCLASALDSSCWVFLRFVFAPTMLNRTSTSQARSVDHRVCWPGSQSAASSWSAPNLPKLNFNIGGRTEDQYSQVCPPGPEDHAQGIPTASKMRCNRCMVPNSRSSVPQARKRLGMRPGATTVFLLLP